MLKIGQLVKVVPHKFYQHLSKGAVIEPPKERQHRGLHKATVVGLYNEGAVEVETNGGHCDIVSEQYVEAL